MTGFGRGAGLAAALFFCGLAHAQTFTVVTLAVAPNAPQFGQQVSLTAHVTPANAPGSVTFMAGTTVLGSGPLNASGLATLNTILLPAGVSTLEAYYQYPGFAPSHSAPIPYIVEAVQGLGFNAASSVPVGAAPSSVAVGDFNGDGKADLAVANSSSGTVTVLIGDGLGAFLPASGSPITVGARPISIAVGDFNGDGNADLAVANLGSSTVSILLGNGHGTFSAAPNSPVGVTAPPVSLAVVDLNGDGMADIVFANEGEEVMVLWGHGDGTFTLGLLQLTDSNPMSLVVADFDGDGNADLAIAAQGSNQVDIYWGTGSGGFKVHAYSTGHSPYGVAVGDFNGDGHPDLAVANAGDNTVSVLLGKGGQGASQFSAAVNYPAGDTPYAVAVGDFNGDGHQDLAVADSTGSNVSILLGLGNGEFVLQTTTYGVGGGPASLAVGDFNGDGRADLAVGNQLTNNVSILPGGTPPSTSITLASSPNPSQYGQPVTLTAQMTPSSAAGTVEFLDGTTVVGIGIVDGTGRAQIVTSGLAPGVRPLRTLYEIVTGERQSESPLVDQTVNAAPGGGFGSWVVYASGANPAAKSIAVGYFNQDNIADLATADYFDNTVSIWTGFGDGTFRSPSTSAIYSTGIAPVSVVAGDFNGDGNADLAVANENSDSVSILLNMGDAAGTLHPVASIPTGRYPESLAVGDFNADGKVDLALAVQGTNTVSVFLGNGDGTFQAAINYGVGTNPTFVVVGDFNGDGKPDLVVTNDHSSDVSLLLGNGNGSFQTAKQYKVGAGNAGAASAVVGDFDGNGTTDLAVITAQAGVFVFLGKGDGTLQAAGSYPVAGGFSSTSAVGDFNGDGKLDLAVPDEVGEVELFLGTGTGAFQPGVLYPAGPGPFLAVAGEFNGDSIQDLIIGSPDTARSFNVMLGKSPSGYTITTNPDGLAMVVDGITYTAPQSFNWAAGTPHVVSAPSPQGTGSTRYVFGNWSDGALQTRVIVALLPGTNARYTANFTPQYLLTTGVNPSGAGAIGANPSSADGYYNSGTSVLLTATPAGSSFSGDLTGTTNPQSVVMSAPRSVTANFGPAPVLSIAKSHTGNFTQGQAGATYAVTVSNAAGSRATSEQVTVTESVPAGMTLMSMNGGATWNCSALPACTTSVALNGGSSYPSITVTVNVASNAASPQVNQVSVTGGGSPNAASSDSTLVFSRCDLNQDGSTNITDLQHIINEAAGAWPAVDDLNQDGSVTIGDVQLLVRGALGSGCSALAAPTSGAAF